MACGVPHGKGMGRLLDELLDMVLRHPEKNTKELLTEQVLLRLQAADYGKE